MERGITKKNYNNPTLLISPPQPLRQTNPLPNRALNLPIVSPTPSSVQHSHVNIGIRRDGRYVYEDGFHITLAQAPI